MIKDLCPTGGRKAFKNIVVHSLPMVPTAQGVRRGAINAACKYVPPHIVARASDHELNCAMENYIEPERALLTPTLLVLLGWPNMPWGELGSMPKHATLLALGEHVDAARLTDMMHDLFHIDSSSPHMFKAGGGLRLPLEAAFATMIMFHEERRKAKEMCELRMRMLDAWATAFYNVDFGDDGKNCGEKWIEKWGKVIRRKFDMDNLHITVPKKSTDMTPLIKVVQNLREDVKEPIAEVKELLVSMNEKLDRVLDKFETLELDVATTRNQLKDLQERVMENVGRTLEAVDLLETLEPTPTPKKSTPKKSTPKKAMSSSGKKKRPPPTERPEPVPPIKRMANIVDQGGREEPKRGLYVSQASAMLDYLAMMEKGGTGPTLSQFGGLGGRGEYSRYKMVYDWFHAMATDTERLQLRDKVTDRGAKKRLVQHLNDLVVLRFAAAFEAASRPVPGTCQAKGTHCKAMTKSFIGLRQTELRKVGKTHEVPLSRGEFQTFRAQVEEDAHRRAANPAVPVGSGRGGV